MCCLVGESAHQLDITPKLGFARALIALQTFDEMSKNVMSAYINQKYVDSRSILPRFRAIVVGKGSSRDKPIIVDFERPSVKTSSTVWTSGTLGTATESMLPSEASGDVEVVVSQPVRDSELRAHSRHHAAA